LKFFILPAVVVIYVDAYAWYLPWSPSVAWLIMHRSWFANANFSFQRMFPRLLHDLVYLSLIFRVLVPSSITTTSGIHTSIENSVLEMTIIA
jgi:hypothetical protein